MALVDLPPPDMPPEGDPAAPIASPAPPAPLPETILSSLADPATAAGNPNREWQQSKPSLPITDYSPQPDDEERDKVQHILELFATAKAERSPMFDQWRRNYQALLNRHSPRPQRPGFLPAPEFPEILPLALTISGWMADQRPTINVAGATVPHDILADLISQMSTDLQFTLDASYKTNMEEREYGLAVMDMVTYGTGVLKTYWDHWAAGGLGDATMCRVSPFNIYPDPMGTTTDDINYIIEARRMTLQELDRRYPGTYDLFADGATGGEVDIDDPPNRTSLLSSVNKQGGPIPGAISPSTRPNTTRSRGGTDRMDPDAETVVTVLECWVREHEPIDVKDPRTGEWTTRNSDEWRVLVVANNRLVFEAHAHDLWDHGKHPYSRMPFVDLGDSFWGMSLVEMLISPQKYYNRFLHNFTQNVELTGRPILKRSRGKSRQQLTTAPGQVIETEPNETDPEWLNPPQIQMAMVNVMEFILSRMEAISGVSAVVKGMSPSGRNAQGVVDSVQEAAFVRIRKTLLNIEFGLRDAFAKKASMICSNYTTPRMVAVAGRGAERTSITLKGGHFLIPSPDGSVPFAYQLNIDAGSQAHQSRAMREDRAIQLYTLGMYDEEAALSDMEIPNWEIIAKRVEAKRQMAAMNDPGTRERQRA